MLSAGVYNTYTRLREVIHHCTNAVYEQVGTCSCTKRQLSQKIAEGVPGSVLPHA